LVLPPPQHHCRVDRKETALKHTGNGMLQSGVPKRGNTSGEKVLVGIIFWYMLTQRHLALMKLNLAQIMVLQLAQVMFFSWRKSCEFGAFDLPFGANEVNRPQV